MAIKHTGTKFKTEISFLNNFVYRVKFKNPSNSCPKVCVGYPTAWFRTRYNLALKISTLTSHLINVKSFQGVLLKRCCIRRFVVQEVFSIFLRKLLFLSKCPEATLSGSYFVRKLLCPEATLSEATIHVIILVFLVSH